MVIYNVMPHLVTALVAFILIGLFSVWSISESDGDTMPASVFSLVFSLVGIVATLFAVVNL